MISEHLLLDEIRRKPASFAEICRRNGLTSVGDRTKFRTILNRLKSRGVIAIVTYQGRAFPSGGSPFLYITTEPRTFRAALEAGLALGFDVEVDTAPPEYQSMETQAVLRGESPEGEPVLERPSIPSPERMSEAQAGAGFKPEPATASASRKPLSPDEWHSLADVGRYYGLSGSEVVERMQRGIASGAFQCIDLLGRPTTPDQDARIGVSGLEPTVLISPPSERTGEATFAFLEFIRVLKDEVVAIRDLPEKLGSSVETAHEFLCFAIRGERVLLGASSPPRPTDLVSLSKSRHVPFLIAADLRGSLIGDVAFKVSDIARVRRCSDDKVVSAVRILAYQSVPALATCFANDFRPLWASEVGSETVIRPGDFRPPSKSRHEAKPPTPLEVDKLFPQARPAWPPPLSSADRDRAAGRRISNAPVSPFLRELTNLLQPGYAPPPQLPSLERETRTAETPRRAAADETPRLPFTIDDTRELRSVAKATRSGAARIEVVDGSAGPALQSRASTDVALPALLKEPLTIEELVMRSGRRRSDVISSLEALAAGGDLSLASKEMPHRYLLGQSAPSDDPEALTTAEALIEDRAIDDDDGTPPGKALKRIEAALWFPRDLIALSAEVRMAPGEVRKVLDGAIGRTILATGTPGGRDERFSAGPQVKQKLASPEVLSLSDAVYHSTADGPVFLAEMSTRFEEHAQLLPFAVARLTGLGLLVRVGNALRRPILVGAILDYCWIPRTRVALDIEFPHIGEAAILRAIEIGAIHQAGGKYLAGSGKATLP